MGLQQIRFVLFESMDSGLAREIADGTGEVFGTEVVVAAERLELRYRGYDPTREQYLASALIRALPPSEPREKTLGITGADLYAPDLNFVFGQAQLPGDCAVMSIARLRPEFWGEEPDREVLIDRGVKEAVHELGHTLGLRHCDDPDCVMHFSNRLADTDRKGRDFCGECAGRLRG